MSPRRKGIMLMGVACGGAALLAGALVVRLLNREPRYQGHALSFWVASLKEPSSDSDAEDHAQRAIRKIGTNALPYLLKWIQYESPQQSSRWRFRTAEIIDKFPIHWVADPISNRLRTPKAEELADGAVDAFPVFTNLAAAFIPELSRMMNDTNKPETAERATEVLCGIGTNSLPLLLVVIGEAGHPCRDTAAAGILEMPGIRDCPQVVVPALISCLSDTNPNTAITAAQSLQELRVAAELTVPALAACLQNTEPSIRFYAAQALGTFGERAAAAIPALTNALSDSPIIRIAAQSALHKIAPERFPKVDLPPGMAAP